MLSKLFPQTSPDADSNAEQERKKREEDEAKENERAWKRMKLGLAAQPLDLVKLFFDIYYFYVHLALPFLVAAASPLCFGASISLGNPKGTPRVRP